MSFYRNLAPVLGQAVPGSYALLEDEVSLRLMLLLEDVQAARPGDVLAGCTVEDAAAILHAIAPLHRRFWQQSPAAWVPSWLPDRPASPERLRQQIRPFLDRYGTYLPADMYPLVEQLPTLIGHIRRRLDEAPHTLVHNDLHLDNVLFDAGKGRTAVILDWQSLAHGPAVLDLVDVIAGSLPAEDAETYETEMLDSWHRMLPDPIRARYSRAQLTRDYGLALLRKLSGVISWLAADISSVSDREALLIEGAISDGRLTGALQQHETMHLLDP